MSTNLEHDAEDNAGPLDRSKVEARLREFGKAYGKGQNSRPSAALLAVDAAHRLRDVGPDDAEKLYTQFAKAAAASQGIEYAASSSHKVQVSKLKVFLTLGALPAVDGVEVMHRTVDKISELSKRAENPLRGSAYDNMCKVARRQKEQPTVELDADAIEGILSEQPADKSELDRVIEAYRKVYAVDEKLAEAGVDHQGTADALEDLAQQIMDMGGELPAMTKEDREVAKARKTLEKAGLVPQPINKADFITPPPSTLIQQGTEEHDEVMGIAAE